MSTNRRCTTIAIMAFDENHSLGEAPRLVAHVVLQGHFVSYSLRHVQTRKRWRKVTDALRRERPVVRSLKWTAVRQFQKVAGILNIDPGYSSEAST